MTEIIGGSGSEGTRQNVQKYDCQSLSYVFLSLQGQY
jgi:hypothetical protein